MKRSNYQIVMVIVMVIVTVALKPSIVRFVRSRSSHLRRPHSTAGFLEPVNSCCMDWHAIPVRLDSVVMPTTKV